MSNANTSDVKVPVEDLEVVLRNVQRGLIGDCYMPRRARRTGKVCSARVPVVEMALDRVAETVRNFAASEIPTEPLDEEQYEAAKANFPLSTSIDALDTSIAIIKTLKGGPRNSLPKIWPKGRKVVPHVEKITRLREEIGGLMEPIEIMHRKWHGIIDAKMAAAKPTVDKAMRFATTALDYHKSVTASYESIERGLIAGADDWWAGAAKRMNVNAPLAMLDELVEKESVIPEYKNRSIELGSEAFELTEVKITQVEEAEKLEDITKKNVALRNEAYEVASISVHMDKLWAQVETAKDLVECLKIKKIPTVEYSPDEITRLQGEVRKRADALPEAYAATTARFKKALADVHWKKATQDVQRNFTGFADDLIGIAGQYDCVQISSIHELETEIAASTGDVARLGAAVRMCEGGVKYARAAELKQAYEKLEKFMGQMVHLKNAMPSAMLTQSDVSDFSDAMSAADKEHSYGAGDSIFREKVAKAEKILAKLEPKVIAMQDFSMMDRSRLDPRLKPLVDSFGGVSGSIPSISQDGIVRLTQYRDEIKAYRTRRGFI